MKQINLLAFFSELYQRFALKSPKFFQYVQAFGVVLMVITGIPELLYQLKTEFGIDLWTMLPGAVQFFASKTIAIAGVLIKLMAKLPVENANHVVNTTNKLPFTEKTK